MKDLRINRRQILQGVGAVGALGALGVPTAVFADEGDEEEETRVRWDLVSVDFVKGTVSAGGTASPWTTCVLTSNEAKLGSR